MVQGDLGVELGLPLADLGVGEAQLVLRLRPGGRLLVEGGADAVQLQLDLGTREAEGNR